MASTDSNGNPASRGNFRPGNRRFRKNGIALLTVALQRIKNDIHIDRVATQLTQNFVATRETFYFDSQSPNSKKAEDVFRLCWQT
jgi:hypothetical protein